VPVVGKSMSKGPGKAASPSVPTPGAARSDFDAAPGWRAWLCALAVLAATCATFWPALDGAWLEWDDVPLLLERDEWRGLSDRHLAWMLTTFHMGPYQPLSWMSYALDHALWGLDPRGYHLTNVLLHAATAACVFFIARRIFAVAASRRLARVAERAAPTSWQVDAAAALAALFWALHPLRVESVAWITERRDCLSVLFLALSSLAWLAHVRRAERGVRSWSYWLAVAAFAAALGAKGLALTLPLALLAIDAWPLGRLGERAGRGARALALVVEKWPFFALSAAAAALAFAGQRAAGAVFESEHHGPVERIAQALYGLAFYVRKTVWPSDLMVLYPMSFPLDAGEPRFVISGVAVALGLALLAVARRRIPAAIVAFACYAAFVAPVLGLTQTGSQLVADRYAYQSCIPLALLAGGALLSLAIRNRWARVALGAGALALVPLAAATRAQIAVWRDTVSLWEHDLAIDPADNPARRKLIATFLNRALEAGDREQRLRHLARALEECREGMEVFPDAAFMVSAAKVESLLADELPAERVRHLEQAFAHARRGVEIAERTLQRYPDVYEACGVTLCKLGRPAEAVPYLEKLARLDPSSAKAHGVLGEALIQARRPRDALAALEQARRIDPSAALVWLDLGDVHRSLGEVERAVECYRTVIALRRRALGAAAAGDGDHEAARRALAELGARE
jgi:tetratricopeptide (TPR) repeat protein